MYYLVMKRLFLVVFILLGAGLFAQANAAAVAPGAQARLNELLNKPAMVSPAEASPLGKNWFRLVTDAHVCFPMK